jgi:hypothetical protein
VTTRTHEDKPAIPDSRESTYFPRLSDCVSARSRREGNGEAPCQGTQGDGAVRFVRRRSVAI